MDDNECSWCGKPLPRNRLPLAVRIAAKVEYRAMAAHILGCVICQQSDGPRSGACTEGQVLAAAACRATRHLEVA